MHYMFKKDVIGAIHFLSDKTYRFSEEDVVDYLLENHSDHAMDIATHCSNTEIAEDSHESYHHYWEDVIELLHEKTL